MVICLFQCKVGERKDEEEKYKFVISPKLLTVCFVCIYQTLLFCYIVSFGYRRLDKKKGILG